MKDLCFKFHRLNKSDVPILKDWLNRPHLQRWWREGDTSLDQVYEKYFPDTVAKGSAYPFIACLDSKPAGYIQYYVAADGNQDWWPDGPGEGVLGIDMFIADGDRLNCGLGTAMAKKFVKFLLKDRKVTEIHVDPNPDNSRAIQCYTKAGFREVGPITTPDGPALMMALKRKSFPEHQI